MFLTENNAVVYTSASDLTMASKCEFAFLRGLDARLGRIERVDEKPDPMLERAGHLGNAYERRVLDRYRASSNVAEISLTSAKDLEALDVAAEATLDAFASGADVVYQATFHERGVSLDGLEIAFLGFADFIVRTDNGDYKVQDTKLARSARVTALLQLAAYEEQLQRLGIPTADTVELLLGDATVSSHAVKDIAPVFRNRRARLHRIIRERFADTDFVAWGDPRYTVCGHCDACEREIERTRDVLLVAGLRVAQRSKLGERSIHSIEDLAASTGDVDGIGTAALNGLRLQAQLQLKKTSDVPPFELVDAAALTAIPAPDEGDIFFDFEGDPLYTEGDATRWGIDYLFGLVDAEEEFATFWAHDFAEEKVALRNFLDFVKARRTVFPNLHIYHYAAYERTHLSSLAARHGIGEDEVDQLLREHVLVDLYPIVRKAVRVGSHSYSIKKLEPLYMGSELRDAAGVTNAADSITEYADAMALRDSGNVDAAQHKLDEIADYNRYDCVSTMRLRDWLRSLAPAHSPVVEPAETPDLEDPEPSPLHAALTAVAGDPLDPDRTDDETAAAFAAAALDYHRREHKTFWWGHFSRLIQPVEEWAETRDVLVVTHAVVERDWFREGKQRSDRRHLRLYGEWAPGSSVKSGGISRPYVLYDSPTPFDDPNANPGARATRQVSVLEVDADSILVAESLAKDASPYSQLPMALTPASPPPAGQQKPAIEEWARAIVDAQPGWPTDPAVDILRRTPPRTRPVVEPVETPPTSTSSLVVEPAETSPTSTSSPVVEPVETSPTSTSSPVVEPVETPTLPPAAGEDYIPAVTRALLSLDHSYLAVQGPPGTGKTYLGAHVIAELVQKHHWNIGVVAQGHAVVENLLNAIVAAGLNPDLVGKVPRDPELDVAFTPLPKDGQLLFALENLESGFVVGGTAWDFANPARVPRRSLDLLVVDEAGQFSLAATIASSVAADNLLLLGDPQQLPQVSQGLHPEPIDGSALGWISAGHDVLPPSLGYFLAASRRMHPLVTAPVSALSYEGALHSHPTALLRNLEQIAPGLHPQPIEHYGNSVESPEESARVIHLVRAMLGLIWSEPDVAARPLTEHDFIVVSPYNAQVGRIAEDLAAAGLPRVRVGTVDKFQGQEAAIAIVSLAASSPADVPRGMQFLLLRNRLNVAISRAKWAAYLLYSPELTEYLPPTPDGVAELSAFIRLVE